MADTFPGLGRTVMELSTDSSAFFKDIDKVERKAGDLADVFQRAAKNLQNFAGETKTVGQAAATAGGQIDKSFKDADKSTTKLGISLKSLGGLIAGALSVGAIKSAVSSFIDLTGQLTDLSAKTGISTIELQKLKYAADLSGGSLEGVTKAITVMAKNLVEGDKSAVEATKRLGLNLNELRQMQPGQAFAAIADAIAKIPSPMEQSTLAMQIFGKSGADVLPMIKGNLGEVMEAAERLGIVLDEETVAAGDNLGDSWTTLTAVGSGVIGKVLKPMLPALQMAADGLQSVGNVVLWLQDAFTKLLEWGVRAIKFFVDATAKIGEFASKIPILGSTMRETDKAAIESLKSWSQWFGDMADGMAVVIPKAVTQTKNLTSAMVGVGLATKEASKSAEEHAKKREQEAKKITESYNALVKAMQAYQLANIQVQQETVRSGLKVEDFGKRVDVSHDNLLAWVNALSKGIPVTNELLEHIDKIGKSIDVAFSPAKIGQLQRFGQSLSQTIMAAFTGGGDAGKSIGAFLGGAAFQVGDTLTSLGKSLTNSLTKVLGSTIGGALGAVLPGIGNLLGALGGELISKLFDRSRGRRAVEEFAKSMGGFDALQARLNKLGTAGQDLWKALTQGVGRNNPEQAAQTIDMVKRRLEELEGAQAEFNTSLQTSLQRVRELGGGIPDAIRPYLNDLRTAGRLTQENIDLLDELSGGGSISWQQLEEAAGRYGASTDKLGQSFNALKLHDAWQQIIDDIDLFERGGADVNALLSDMSDEISKLVQDSIKFGTDIPENMRPWIERLIAAGELVDESGEKITDVGKLKFGETLQTSLQKLTDEIKRLILTLGGVPAAIDAIPDSVDVDVNYHENRIPSPDADAVTESASGGGVVGNGRILPFRRGGFVPSMNAIGQRLLAFAPKGTDTVPAMLTPRELILNEGQQQALQSVLGSTLRGLSMAHDMARDVQLMATGTGGVGMAGVTIERGAFSDLFRGANITRESVPLVGDQIADSLIAVLSKGGERRTRVQRVLGVKGGQ